MDEPLCFDEAVASGAYEDPCYPLFNDEESDALFRAFTNKAWEGLGPVSNLGVQSTSPMCLPAQTLEEAPVVHSTSPSSAPSSLFSSSPSPSKRVTKPVSNNMMTGLGKVTPPTPTSPVVQNDVPAPAPAPAANFLTGSVDLSAAFSASMVAASVAFANTIPAAAHVQQNFDLGQAPIAPTSAYTGQYQPELVTQSPTFTWSRAAPAPVPLQYAMQSMPPPPYYWDVMPMAPVFQQLPPQAWPAPVPRDSTAAVASFGQQHQAQQMSASAPVNRPTVSATPPKKRTLEFVDPVVPKGFVANPNNHGRFQYVDGQRIYMNGAKAKKLRKSATQRA